MRAGALDRRITIERLTTTQNAAGEAIKTWAALATVWAQVAPQTGREILTGALPVAEADMVFRIRWRSDLDRTMRVSFDGQLYGIVHIAEMGRRQGHELVCKGFVD